MSLSDPMFSVVASVAIALTATLSVCGGKMLRDQVLQMLRVGDDWSYSESDMSEFSDMPEKGGYEDAHVSKERDDTKIMQTTVLRQDEGIENDDQQLSQILEQIDSARPGGKLSCTCYSSCHVLCTKCFPALVDNTDVCCVVARQQISGVILPWHRDVVRCGLKA